MAPAQMTSVDRAQWMAVLEAASQQPTDRVNDEWEWLLDQLGLPLTIFEAVLEAVQQGRWRSARNPKGYVKTVAKREAKKMGLLDEAPIEYVLVKVPGDQGICSVEGALESLIYEGDTSNAIRGEDGVWRRGGGRQDDFNNNDNPRENVSYREFLRLKMPKELRETVAPSEESKALFEKLNENTDEFHFTPAAREQIDWAKLAELAGFNELDRLVLECRLNGVSRDQALAESSDEASRRALQAAWRKFDRRGVERIQEALKKNFAKSVPE